MRRSFLEDSINAMYVFEKALNGVAINAIKKNTTVDFPEINENLFPFFYLDEALERFNSLTGVASDLENFYSNVYKSQKINTVPTSIPVSDISEVKTIKPQYLVQFVENGAQIIDDGLKEKLNSKFLTPEFTKNLKKQVVVSTLPDYIKDKDLVVLDNRFVMNVNGNFITQTILPFVRSLEVQKKEFAKTASKIKESITKCSGIMSSYISTYKRMISEGKTNASSLKAIHDVFLNFVTVGQYMIVAFIRKVNAYSNNMQEFIKLQQTLVRYFPAGEREMHESVLDGINDFDTEDIVHDIVYGDCDFLMSVRDRVFRTFYDWLEEASGEHGTDIILPVKEYDKKPYNDILMMFRTIGIAWKTLYDELQNPDSSIEDILEKSGLTIPFITQFEHLLSRVESIDFYTEYEDVKAKDVYVSILNELKSTQETIADLGSIANKLYRKLKSIESSVKQNINNQYENHERNTETLEAIRNVEKNYRDFLGKLSISILDRYKKLEDLLMEEDIDFDDEVDDSSITLDETDYAKEATKMNLELMEAVHLIELNEAYQDFNRVMTESYFDDISDVIMEADANAQSTVNTGGNDQGQNTSTNNNGDNTNSNTNNNNNSTTATVQDNNADNNSGNGNNSGKTGFSKLIETIKNFITNLIEKIKGLVKKNQTNSQWIAQNKEALLNRSYTNTSINILPYVEDSDPLKIINDISTELASINKGDLVKMTKDDIERRLLKKVNLNNIEVPNADKKDANLSQKITQYLKVGNGKFELVQKKDGEVTELIPKMIEYCEKFYGGFEDELNKASDTVSKNFDKVCQEIQNDNTPEPSDEKDGNVQSKMTSIGTLVQTALGASVNAARDRAQDYLKVLQAFAPKPGANKPANNANNNQNQESNDNNQNSNEEGEK